MSHSIKLWTVGLQSRRGRKDSAGGVSSPRFVEGGWVQGNSERIACGHWHLTEKLTETYTTSPQYAVEQSEAMELLSFIRISLS